MLFDHFLGVHTVEDHGVGDLVGVGDGGGAGVGGCEAVGLCLDSGLYGLVDLFADDGVESERAGEFSGDFLERVDGPVAARVLEGLGVVCEVLVAALPVQALFEDVPLSVCEDNLGLAGVVLDKGCSGLEDSAVVVPVRGLVLPEIPGAYRVAVAVADVACASVTLDLRVGVLVWQVLVLGGSEELE